MEESKKKKKLIIIIVVIAVVLFVGFKIVKKMTTPIGGLVYKEVDERQLSSSDSDEKDSDEKEDKTKSSDSSTESSDKKSSTKSSESSTKKTASSSKSNEDVESVYKLSVKNQEKVKSTSAEIITAAINSAIEYLNNDTDNQFIASLTVGDSFTSSDNFSEVSLIPMLVSSINKNDVESARTYTLSDTGIAIGFSDKNNKKENDFLFDVAFSYAANEELVSKKLLFGINSESKIDLIETLDATNESGETTNGE